MYVENLQPAVMPDVPIHDYDFGAGMLIVPRIDEVTGGIKTHMRALVCILGNLFYFKALEGTKQELETAAMGKLKAEFIQELAAQGIKYPFEQ